MVKVNPVLTDRYDINLKCLPIWEIHDFFVPDITDWKDGEAFEQYNSKLLETNNRIELSPKNSNFISLLKDIDNVREYIINQGVKDYDLNSLWFDHLNNLVPAKNLRFLCDKPGWEMFRHLDHRAHAGVLIINLIDNPENTGTMFGNSQLGEVEYTSPIGKGSGVFFLNTHNAWHSVSNLSDRNRYILYVPFTIPINI
jgi:hypothetical protein